MNQKDIALKLCKNQKQWTDLCACTVNMYLFKILILISKLDMSIITFCFVKNYNYFILPAIFVQQISGILI